MAEDKPITNQKAELNVKKNNTMGYKITIGILSAIIIVLLWMLLFTNEKVKVVTVEKDNVEMERAQLEGELESLMVEYEDVKTEYGELTDSMTTKDSVIQANAAEIKKLLARTSDYRKVKRQLKILRGIQQSYVDQLDSLYTVNHELEEKLDIATQDIRKEKTKTQNLSKEKEELSKKVEAGSAIKAYNVTGTAFYLKGRTNREVETLKARRTERIKICFTLAENLVVEPGPKTVYIRVARPDGVIIRKGDGDEYSFQANGSKLQFTMKEDIQYANKAKKMCVLWDKQSENAAMKGTYNISVFMDNIKIGSSSFTLE